VRKQISRDDFRKRIHSDVLHSIYEVPPRARLDIVSTLCAHLRRQLSSGRTDWSGQHCGGQDGAERKIASADFPPARPPQVLCFRAAGDGGAPDTDALFCELDTDGGGTISWAGTAALLHHSHMQHTPGPCILSARASLWAGIRCKHKRSRSAQHFGAAPQINRLPWSEARSLQWNGCRVHHEYDGSMHPAL
jgi:hypothetical protein